MRRLLRGTAYAVMGLLGMLLLALAGLVLLVDPNDYRDDLSRLARDKAGVELTLGGELSWRFFPVLGFVAEDVGLALAPNLPRLVTIRDMTLGVELLPLLSKSLRVDELIVDGLQAALVVDAEGNNNWTLPVVDEPAQTPPAETDVDNDGAADSAWQDIVIPLVELRNAGVNYHDHSTDSQYDVQVSALTMQQVNVGQPFPIELALQFSDGKQLQVASTLSSSLVVKPDEQLLAMQGIELTADIEGLADAPLRLRMAADINLNQQQDTASVVLKPLQLADMQVEVNIQAEQLSQALAYSGKLKSNTFNARKLLDALAIAVPEMRDAQSLQRAQFSADFSGSTNAIRLEPLSIQFDDSILQGSVAVADFNKQALRFDLQLDQLDADRYLAPADSEAAAPAAPAQASPAEKAELIPVELLRSLDVTGQLSANRIVISDIPVTAIKTGVAAQQGVFNISDLGMNLLGGTAAGQVTLDVRGEQPVVQTDIDVNNVAIQDLLAPFLDIKLLSGATSLSLNTNTSGNDVQTLLEQALGQLNLQLSEATLHGVNLNQLALQTVKQKLGDFTLLYPDYQQQLPTTLKDDTAIRDMLAKMTIEKGHLLLPDFKAETGEGNITAKGDIDLLQQGFDYQFGVELAALRSNKYLQGTRWPIHCQGSLQTPVAQWCRPDSKMFNTIFENAAKQALRNKGAQKVGEQLGLENADEEAAKEELRRKAREEEERAKKKLQEKLDSKLDKLFGRD